jgi:hypothetical protein
MFCFTNAHMPFRYEGMVDIWLGMAASLFADQRAGETAQRNTMV